MSGCFFYMDVVVYFTKIAIIKVNWGGGVRGKLDLVAVVCL